MEVMLLRKQNRGYNIGFRVEKQKDKVFCIRC